MPDSAELVHRAIDLSDAEDFTGALNLLTRAITADPINAQAYFERGMVLLNLDQDANAVADFDRALAIDPDFPGARDWRSKALASLGDHQSAAEGLLKDLQSHPDGPHQGMGVSPQNWADCADALSKLAITKRQANCSKITSTITQAGSQVMPALKPHRCECWRNF